MPQCAVARGLDNSVMGQAPDPLTSTADTVHMQDIIYDYSPLKDAKTTIHGSPSVNLS